MKLTANPPALPAVQHGAILSRVRMVGSTADGLLGQGDSQGASFEAECPRG
jgi:hypothetical protein